MRSPSVRHLLFFRFTFGLNVKDSEQCVGAACASESTRIYIQLGRAAGVTGTPVLFVNDPLVRAVPDFQSAVEALLSSRDAKNK